MVSLLKIARLLVEDAFRWVLLLFPSAEALRAENLFLRRQLALYIERGMRPHRVDPATRISLALLARRFDWRSALVVVQPATMIRWHRAGWRLLWRVGASIPLLSETAGLEKVAKDSLASLMRSKDGNDSRGGDARGIRTKRLGNSRKPSTSSKRNLGPIPMAIISGVIAAVLSTLARNYGMRLAAGGR
jgi:hypothetical protein